MTIPGHWREIPESTELEALIGRDLGFTVYGTDWPDFLWYDGDKGWEVCLYQDDRIHVRLGHPERRHDQQFHLADPDCFEQIRRFLAQEGGRVGEPFCSLPCCSPDRR